MKEKPYSLIEINSLIKETIEDKFFDYFSIVAEIGSLNVNISGHCYIELVQKDEISEQIVAKMRATIWASSFAMINSYFSSITGEPLKSGIKVLIKASVTFHELYGLSLNIVDIDPNYTLGDIERKKQEILNRLDSEGVIEMNKELDLPRIPKTIAIISSETAAGYEDFLEQLQNNSQGFVYHTKLFKAYMQGEKVEKSIIDTLDRIYEHHEYFDLVIIIRGGGSKIELGAFDNYNIAYYITQFPLPVITGIGHERDNSICDIVAHTSVKTPTAAAEFVINLSNEFLFTLNNFTEDFQSETDWIIESNKNIINNFQNEFLNSTSRVFDNSFHKLEFLDKDLKNTVNQVVSQEYSMLDTLTTKTDFIVKSVFNNQTKIIEKKKNILQDICNYYFQNIKHKIEIFEVVANQNNPQKILAQGYTYITKNGKFIKDLSVLKDGDIIVNKSINNNVTSKVVKK